MPGSIPHDPRSWTQADIDAFCDDASPEEIDNILSSLLSTADDVSMRVMAGFLRARHGHLMLKPTPSQLAIRAILSLGPSGVDFLISRLTAHEVRYGPSVLSVLWHVARGRGLVTVMTRVPQTPTVRTLPSGTEEAARRAIRNMFQDARVDPLAFWQVASFLFHDGLREALLDEDKLDFPAMMSLFGEGAIRLSSGLLDEFSRLIAADLPEERYQEFLAQNPALLDPLAAEVVPKQRLGIEHATDYAVRTHDDRWTLVEIERPQDELFTKGDDFRERFTHAFGQVLDFQTWVDENVAYAQKHMGRISAPRGLLVMGLRSRLTPFQASKLRRFCDNSRRIEVCTYDDLLARSTSLYRNIIDSPF